jgi:hypothetical protein
MPNTKITVETVEQKPSSMWLKFPIASAELEGGRTFEISSVGSSLLLEIRQPKGTDPNLERRVAHTLSLGDLAEKWVAAVEAQPHENRVP